MPPPIPVELQQYDPAWPENARHEAQRLTAGIGEAIGTVHHIGSTAIPGMHAKPIIDLIPVVLDLAGFDRLRPVVEGLGYVWWGEYGLPGRRYCTLDDPLTGRRKVQLHCYQKESYEITRHLAFRDYLRANPDLAREYDAEKNRCRDLSPLDSHAYTDCKAAWIRRIEAQALAATASINRT